MIPTREVKTTRNVEPFLDELPEERLRKGNFANVPVLMMMTPDEGSFIYSAREKSEFTGCSNKKANFPPILTLGARENSNAPNVKIGGFTFLFEHPV